MNEPILPDNDIDVRLARKLGVLLEQKAPLSGTGDDPFVDVLGQLRAFHIGPKAEILPDRDTSDRMWQAILAATGSEQPAVRPIAKIFFLQAFSQRAVLYRIAAAACLFAAVVLSWMFLFKAPAPVLLAQADQEISTTTLADGTSIILRPHSKLYGLPSDSRNESFILEGEGYFDVAHNENRTFRVEAGDAFVSVLGTEFNVNTWQSSAVKVFLQEGRVELKNRRSGQSVILSPGQAGTVQNDQVTLHSQPADSLELLDWLNNEITFSSTPFLEVIEEIEFHYAIDIDIPQERANETIGGTIPLDDVTFVLDGLSTVMGGGRFVQTGEHSYRFEAN